MGLFEKLVSIPALRPHLDQDEQAFVEDPGWRAILQKVKQLKDPATLLSIFQEASPTDEKQKIIRGYLATMAAEGGPGPVELPCVDYAGCYLSRGELKLTNPSPEVLPCYVGMGMQATSP